MYDIIKIIYYIQQYIIILFGILAYALCRKIWSSRLGMYIKNGCQGRAQVNNNGNKLNGFLYLKFLKLYFLPLYLSSSVQWFLGDII